MGSRSILRWIWIVFYFACPVLAAEPSGTIDFENDVEPILSDNCWHCHGEDEQESGLRLDNRLSMLKGGFLGLPTIVPGEPERSFLLDVVKHLEADLEMPPDGDRLSDADIAILERWIKDGAVWPGQMQSTLTTEKSDHWSFQPIVRPDVPKKAAEQNPIDAFLKRRLENEGLSFSPSADAKSLLRRVSIVLTGLMPTPEETEKFLSQWEIDSDAAYSQAVERLLASPHFGERWAQHWLDVIRWAETNGSESNMYRKNAWKYRDYVIDAFNNDKPYDEFLFEQLAGDSVGQGIATGYLVSGPHVPVATVGQEPSARRQARADRMDEIVQTVGISALGVTVGCARCHNHKFDPITITDYYEMTAVFQDVEFGGRIPEFSEDHPRRIIAEELQSSIERLRKKVQDFGPWEEHWTAYRDIHFAPQETNQLRITFLAKTAWVDELEIFGPEKDSPNYALSAWGTVAFSPEEFAQPRRELYKIHDGEYGTEQWSGASPEGSNEKPWIEFKLPERAKISRVRVSSNREDFFETDYLEKLNTGSMAPYVIEILDESGAWVQVAATPVFKKLDKKSPERADAMKELQRSINDLIADGPEPSFVGRFIKPANTFVLSRGSPESPRDEVFSAGLSELGGDLGIPNDAAGVVRRSAFARWLTGPENPLTARVAVNRLWHHVFGRGIVSTPGDFGVAGAAPTHPELLDWLAAELKAPTQHTSHSSALPWTMKRMVRIMVMSRAFRQSSQPRQTAIAVDAGSTLLWRFPPRRVEAEVIRDSVLRASGCLDTTVGGKSYRIHNVKKRYAQWQVTDNHGPATWRRMIYQERMRRVDDGMFTAFDFPDCGQIQARRPV